MRPDDGGEFCELCVLVAPDFFGERADERAGLDGSTRSDGLIESTADEG